MPCHRRLPSFKRRFSRLLLGAVAAALLLAPVALTAGDTTLTFEDATAGEVIGTQYSSSGVVFASDPTVYGVPNNSTSLTCADPVATSTAASSAHSGTIALTGGTCYYGEFPSPGNVFMVFSKLRSSVSVKILDPGGAPSAPHTLTGYDTNGNQVATASVPGTSSSTWLTLNISTATAQIAYATVYGRRFVYPTDLYDDLTFDNPAVQPDVSPAFQQTAPVVQGKSQDFSLSLTRFNGSNGNVTLSVSGLPSGVTGSVSPATLTGTTTNATLTLSAADTAAQGSTTFTITATPQSLAAGSQPRSIQRTVHVEAPYTFSTQNTGFVAPCTTYTYPIKLEPAAGFTGPVDVTAGPGSHAPAGTTVSVSPGVVSASTNWSTTLTVVPPSNMVTPSSPLTSGPAFGVNLTGTSSGVPNEGTTLIEYPYAGHVKTVSSPQGANVLSTPVYAHWASTSSAFTLSGEGFCPGTKVEVGNALAQAGGVPTPSRRQLAGTVPALATSGMLHVLTPNGGDLPYSSVHVNSFRDAFGFQFRNGAVGNNGFPLATNADLDSLYGKDETNFNFYGLRIRKPEAGLLQTVTNKSLKNGFCFGFSVESAALLGHLDVPYIYPPFKNVPAFGLDGSSGPSDQLGHRLASVYSMQFSDEVIPQVVNQVFGQWAVPQGGADVHEIEGELAKGSPPLVSMIPGLSGGHSVLAYATEHLSDGSTAIDVYDSNLPYDPNSEEDFDGTAHRDRELGSRIIVKPNGDWTFHEPGGLDWNGDQTTLLVFKQSKMPLLDGKSPHVPNYFTILGVFIFMGSTGDQVVQATDASGRTRFDLNGNLKPEANSPKIAVWTPFGTPGDGSSRVIAADGHDLNIDVQRHGRPSDIVLNGHALGADLQTGPRHGLDAIGWHPARGTLSLRSGSASPVTASLTASIGAHAEHVAQIGLGASKSGSDAFSFEHGGTLSLNHRGAATTAKITLQTLGNNQQPVAVALPPLHVGRGERVTIRPVSWAALGTKAVKVVTGGRARFVRVRTLGRVFAHVAKASLARKNNGVQLSLRLRVGRLPAGARLSLAATLRRGGRTIRLAPALLSPPTLRRGNVTVLLSGPKLAAGLYSIAVALASESTVGRLIEPAAVTHFSRRSRLR